GSSGNLYAVEWLSAEGSPVWKRDAATGKVRALLVADTDVQQLIVAGSGEWPAQRNGPDELVRGSTHRSGSGDDLRSEDREPFLARNVVERSLAPPTCGTNTSLARRVCCRSCTTSSHTRGG